jgi:hypothetical protein
MEHSIGPGKTKPIRPGLSGARFRADARCETKPIPASRDAGGGSGFPSRRSALPVNCAKQTQFRQREKKRQVLGGKGFMVNRTVYRPRQNKASCPKRGTGAVSRRCRAGRGPQGRGTRGKCAKQTQFRAEQKEGQRLGGKGVMVNSTFDRPRQNKANFRRFTTEAQRPQRRSWIHRQAWPRFHSPCPRCLCGE